MPTLSKTFEFFNPWLTRNTRTSQPSITMPQMVNGQRPIAPISLSSEKLPAAGFYGLGARPHAVNYIIEGAFIGTVQMQYSNNPNPQESDWIDIPSTYIRYFGNETTGGAGIAGGYGGISRPTKTDVKEFTGDYAWLRATMTIRQGTLRSVKLNF